MGDRKEADVRGESRMKHLIYILAIIGGMSVLCFVLFVVIGIVNLILEAKDKKDKMIERPGKYVLKKRR